MSRTVAEMTTEELKEMLGEVIETKLVELLGDPDEGEDLREGLIERLKLQRSAVEHGERGESLLALKVSPADAGDELLMAAAVKLFELGRLSSGAAARLAGVPRTVFLSRLADYGVDTLQLTEEDLERETRLA